jgi:hypothetical protein
VIGATPSISVRLIREPVTSIRSGAFSPAATVLCNACAADGNKQLPSRAALTICAIKVLLFMLMFLFIFYFPLVRKITDHIQKLKNDQKGNPANLNQASCVVFQAIFIGVFYCAFFTSLLDTFHNTHLTTATCIKSKRHLNYYRLVLLPFLSLLNIFYIKYNHLN